MKIPVINSQRRSRVVYYRNCYSSKQIFEEFAGGAEHFTSPQNKAFLPRIIRIKRPGLVKIG